MRHFFCQKIAIFEDNLWFPPLSNGYHHPTITFVCRGTLLAFTFDDNSRVEERPNYQLISLCTYVLFGEFLDVHNYIYIYILFTKGYIH